MAKSGHPPLDDALTGTPYASWKVLANVTADELLADLSLHPDEKTTKAAEELVSLAASIKAGLLRVDAVEHMQSVAKPAQTTAVQYVQALNAKSYPN